MIVNFINFKLDSLFENEEQQDFEKGKIYSGKIIDSDKNGAVLLFRGRKIPINTNLNLKLGENVEFILEKIENDNIFLKIVENNKINNEIDSAINLILKEFRFTIKKEKINEIKEIYIKFSEGEADNIDNKNKTIDGKIDISLLKTLIYHEAKNISLNIHTIRYLYSYFNKEIDETIDNFKEFKQKLKKHIKNIKKSNSNHSKGINIVNSNLSKEKTGEIEFSFSITELKNHVEIKIKKDSKNSESNDEKEDGNYYLNIKTKYEKFGEVEVKLSQHKRKLDAVLFSSKNSYKLEKNLNILINQLSEIGFSNVNIKVRKKELLRAEDAEGINIKI